MNWSGAAHSLGADNSKIVLWDEGTSQLWGQNGWGFLKLLTCIVGSQGGLSAPKSLSIPIMSSVKIDHAARPWRGREGPWL